MLNALTFIVNNGWKYWGDYVEVKDDSNLAMNFLTGEWSPSDEVMTELVSKIKRFRREERMKIKFTWVSRDTKAQPTAD